MKFLLIALHSSYPHTSLALPCLLASCRDMNGAEFILKEFTVNEDRRNIFENISQENADVLVFSCYAWNRECVLGLARMLKHDSPDIFIILGGPEVSFDADSILGENSFINCIIRGEGEAVFRSLAEALINSDNILDLNSISGITYRSHNKITNSKAQQLIMPLDKIPSPFALELVDTKKPLVYFETSRGCPFTCAFCLSANDSHVRSFSMDRIKSDLQYLIDAGVKTIKFVDRTFNYNAKRANEIWQFILNNNRTSRYHFEIAADLLTNENIDLLKTIPDNTFRFEIGVQSIAEETLSAVSRNSNIELLFNNITRLIKETSVDVHLDLVAGLPGENYKGFLASLERLIQLAPYHIQTEPLKVLKGAPMIDIACKENYKWYDLPPYRIISTPYLNAQEVDRIDTIGRITELVYNSHRFKKTLECAALSISISSFLNALATDWEVGGIEALSMEQLFEFVWSVGAKILPPEILPVFREALIYDRCMADYLKHKDLPSFFSSYEGFDCRVSRNEIFAIRKRSQYSPDTKIRGVRWFFKNISLDNTTVKNKTLFFLYLSRPGRKQEVSIIEHET